MTACVCGDVIFVLVYESVCGALCECLQSKRRAPSICRTTCLSKSNRGENLEGREGGGKGEGRDGWAQLKGEQDGTNGEIYNNGR